MDFTLRCNDLKCRNLLPDKAVVTTCSHVFCEACFDRCQQDLRDNSLRIDGGIRQCPACHTKLVNPDDAVVTNLQPAEDYKTSVLSGLSPTIIMECAGRGLAFFSYQVTQEVVYQEFLATSLTAKFSKLKAEFDNVVHSANAQIGDLQEKLEDMKGERQDLIGKNNQLVSAFRDKNKVYQHLQKEYQILKAKNMTNDVRTAASDDAEMAVQSAAPQRHTDRLGPRGANMNPYVQPHTDRRGMERIHSRQKTGGSGGSSGDGLGWDDPTYGSRTYTARGYKSLGYSAHSNSLTDAESVPVGATPSQHRTRLPMPHPGPSLGMGSQNTSVFAGSSRSQLNAVETNPFNPMYAQQASNHQQRLRNTAVPRSRQVPLPGHHGPSMHHGIR
ncbi:hypothetical protein K402DRAFT_422601 [Aulographum hederae CBS 113979]|uniref:RING-type domain-containing protein n=1 Tax=Aulographum hederae CBS 113979 TaxID=1176131 RepID=A0A6G1GVB7_9PEZI|nr:hypothetical protein K402DRAFT_422601 [Aulographum hederae CBS 113979]